MLINHFLFFFYYVNLFLYLRFSWYFQKQLLLFIDMENEVPISSLETNLLYRFPSETIKDRIKKFFGLPKSIHEGCVDNEQCSWRMLTIQKKKSINKCFFFF